MFCKNCGKEIDTNSKFCNYCGASQESSSPDSTVYNIGKALGAIGSIVATNMIVDGFIKKDRESFNRTMEISSLNNEKVQLMMERNGGSISEEEYNRRCYDIDKKIKEIRDSAEK